MTSNVEMTPLETRHQTSTMELTLSGVGKILSLSPRPGSEIFCQDVGEWSIQLNESIYSQADFAFSHSELSSHNLIYNFVNESKVQVSLEYEIFADRPYFKRRFTIKNLQETVLRQITFPRLETVQSGNELIPYSTFWNCPTVVFWRGAHDGYFLGIENPVCQEISDANGIQLFYEPNMKFVSQGSYIGEFQFVGRYHLGNKYVVEEPPKSRIAVVDLPRRTRFRNPSGQVPIDIKESQAMQQYLRDYLKPFSQDFEVILYCYWFPIPRFPQGVSDIEIWKRTIEQFVLLGGTTIMTYPLVVPEMPTLDPRSYWDLEPDGSAAKEIMDYARSQGLRIGYYMGCAAGNLEYGATAFNFPADAPKSWKKTDRFGDDLGENCIASSEYRNWALQVIGNTIKKYDISLWGWDPGPGNALFCHSESHSHSAGNGNYSGWRHSVEVVADLAKRFATTKFVGFYGTKEFGPWGLRNFYQHEGYFEQQLEFGAGVYPDVSSDRQTANGIRMQAWWSQNFRFLPAEINHTLVGRLSQYCMDPIELSEPWDRWGWQFSLLSAIAIGSSVTLAIIPDDVIAVRGMQSFYKFWIGWAKENQHLLQFDRALGSQVRIGEVDAHFRIGEREGVIFLSNPSPRPSTFHYELSGDLGFKPGLEYEFTIVSSEGNERLNLAGTQKFQYDQKIAINISAYGILVLEVNAIAKDKKKCATLEKASDISQVFNSLFEEVTYVCLDNWSSENLEIYDFPNQSAQSNVLLTTHLNFNVTKFEQIVDETKLHSSTKKLRQKFKKWQERGFPDTFLWDATDRVIFLVPFADSDLAGIVHLSLNGEKIAMNHWMLRDMGTGLRFSGEVMPFKLRDMGVIWWADVTEHIQEVNEFSLKIASLSAQQFLGPLLVVPQEMVDSGSCTKDRTLIYDGAISDSHAVPLQRTSLPASSIIGISPSVLIFQTGTILRCEVTVGLPLAELSGVYFSALVGSGSWGDMPMKPISEFVWSLELTIGRKDEHILESNYAYIWLEDLEGRSSASKTVNVEWIYSKVR